jgi:hypothetical protein
MSLGRGRLHLYGKRMEDASRQDLYYAEVGLAVPYEERKIANDCQGLLRRRIGMKDDQWEY